MTTSCDNTLEEISAWDKLIEGQSDLIEDLKAELKKGKPSLSIELGSCLFGFESPSEISRTAGWCWEGVGGAVGRRLVPLFW